MTKITKTYKRDALRYHAHGRPGKMEVVPTKPYRTQRDLSLAYSPGVAEPCLRIQDNKEDAYIYTSKSNLVGVISNGTAVLGLGNIGALAGKPVMEGKGLLFKIFADIDVFDIEVDTTDTEKFIETVKAIAPTFGGINLEDIKAPECFEIEKRLKEELDIPVMHDDQHGTAIISGAGLINALHLTDKKIEEILLVVNGAGAAAVSCTNLYISLGVKKENVIMCDSRGVLNEERTDLNDRKKPFVTKRKLNTLKDAIKGADVFLGLSVGGVLSKEMVLSMADKPIIFALANPNPEITYEDALEANPDVIIATGRSDYPNQINNVIGFPYIFRGALDVRASDINEQMKISCVHAIAELTRQDVPESVMVAYNQKNIVFGKKYIVPKATDPRLITVVAPAVAKTAMETGVARRKIANWDFYVNDLKKRLGIENELIRTLFNKAKKNPKKVVFAEAENYSILRAAQLAYNEGIAYPILLGNKKIIRQVARENDLELNGIEIIDIRKKKEKARRREYAAMLAKKRARDGFTLKLAIEKLFGLNYFAAMMVESGDADAFISGYSSRYRDVIQVTEEVIGIDESMETFMGLNVMLTKNGPYFFADTTINSHATEQAIIGTTLCAAKVVRKFNMEPNIAMVSYSNFGSVKRASTQKIHKVVEYLHQNNPELVVDGEMFVDFALDQKKRDKTFPFNKLQGKDVNTLIFPNLSSGNLSYKLLKNMGGIETLGPILVGAKKAVQIVQIGSSSRDILNLTAMAVVDAQK